MMLWVLSVQSLNIGCIKPACTSISHRPALGVTSAMWRGILFSSLLFQVIAAATRPHFLVVFPNAVRAEIDTKACIHLNYLNETLNLTLTLQTDVANNTLLTEIVTDTRWYRCIHLQGTLSGLTAVGEATLEVVGKGDTYQFEKTRKIFLQQRRANGTFIQTDKPVYKPGQTVKFRIVTLNENFIPDPAKIPLVEIQDPQKNRIAQWLNVETQQGIGDLFFSLASEPLLGSYKIQVQKGESLTQHIFTVEEYVLPKFEVQLNFPPVIRILDKEFTLTVCGRYTYGKPVRGTAQVSLCRESFYYWNKMDSFELTKHLCMEFNGSTDANGCFSKVIGTRYFHLRTPAFEMEIRAEAKLVEDGTGLVMMGSGTVSVSSHIAKLRFEGVNEYYKPGIPVNGKVVVEDAAGSPAPGKNVTVCHNGDRCETYTTDNKGQAYFSLNTSIWDDEIIQLQAKLENAPPTDYSGGKHEPIYETAFQSLRLQYSKSKSYLGIQSAMASELPCDVDLEISVNYVFKRDALEGSTESLDFSYLVMTESKIVLEGQKQMDVGASDSLEGIFSIKIPVGVNVAPEANVLVYILLPNDEVIADSRKFQISKCFRNKVKLQFLAPEVPPGSDSHLQLQAAPGSLCAVQAVDKSVLLLKPEEELSDDKVYRAAKGESACHYAHHLDMEPSPCLPPDPEEVQNRSYIQYPYYHSYNEMDPYKIFWDMGLNVLTDISMRKPVSCYIQFTDLSIGPLAIRHSSHDEGVALAGLAPMQPTPLISEETVRKYFPETWIWDLVPVGSSGKVEVPITVPDTITEWKAGMFCIANIGFGLANTVALNVFQPFFVEPALPYSVIRGEVFTLKATVFNHLQQCIMVQVTLVESEDFQSVTCEKCDYTSCICGGKGKTFFWDVIPKSLGEVNFTISAEAIQTDELCENEIAIVPERGRKDTVIKPLLVESEGTEVEMAKSSLLCPDGSTLLEEISLLLPREVVEGSARAHISVIGDIMGTAMQNLDKLLVMPYGCGEQNMLLFAPNIYILQYLKKTSQLTEEIREKAIRFLESGYQRELTYKHRDGSYSAFGNSDPEGNTWLTAFVVKSFGQAKPYIFIDDQHIADAFSWLEEHQSTSGCFQNVGKLFHSSMKGGVDDDISLSAYITAALLEIQLPLNNTMLNNSLLCLEQALPNITNPYTLALLAYTYTLAGYEETRKNLLERLDSLAIKEDGMVHWERPQKPAETDSPYYWNRAPSAEVEMTAYVLLALLSSPKPSMADISSAALIVKWITKQQGPNGGFSSTQDTVVALHALSKYGGLTYSEKGHITLRVKSDQQLVANFEVSNENRLLLQWTTLTDIPGIYTAEIEGQGCALFQTTLKYNIPPPKNESTFSIQVETSPRECTEFSRASFHIIITVSYTGKREVSNMAIIEVKMLSGYIPDKKSVRLLQSSTPVVKKTEVKTTHVILYLEELSHDSSTFLFRVEQDVPVRNLKPAVIKIYDYYETDEHAITEYSAPCSAADKEEDNTR